MVRMAAEAGTTDIVATPHANVEFPFRPDLIEQRISDLRQASGNVLRIHRGCDFHLYYDNIQDALRDPGKYAINQRRYVLVEFPDLMIPNTMDEVFQRMRAAGMTPVITHPERNRLLHKRLDEIARWVESGCLVQVTAQSFLGRFGRTAKNVSEELMERRLVHFVASDAHDPKHRPPVLTEAYEYVTGKYGESLAEALFVTNPKATLAGEEIEIEPPVAEAPKKWYQFWL
jgi:protein-tyrosine phosphatase